MVGFIGDDVTEINLSVFTDADFAGDVCSQRSTTCLHLCVQCLHAYCPLHGQRKVTDRGRIFSSRGGGGRRVERVSQVYDPGP